MANVPPYYYQYENAVSSLIQPSTVHIHNTGLARFFKRGLLARAISVVDVECPDNWDVDYLLYCLFCWGYVTVIKTNRYGVIPQACSLYGYNVYYKPTETIVTNPLLRTVRSKIGVNCALIKLKPDYCGIMDTVDFYGDCLALCADTAQVNVLNSKLSYIFSARNKSAAETFKKAFDNIASGEPAVAVGQQLYNKDGEMLWNSFTQDLKRNFIAPDILNTMRVVYNMFDTELGIPNSNQSKRERLVTDEVNSNNIETYTCMDMYIDTLNRGCEECKRLFNIDVKFKWRFKPVIEGGELDERNSVNTRNLQLR